MKYNHPTEIPHSKNLFFEWAGERIPLADKLKSGDSHAQTWAGDDVVYIGTGDPLWYERDGKAIHFISENEDVSSEEAQAAMIGLVVEKLTGEPENLILDRVNDMIEFVGYGGKGPKPSGMVCVDGVLYYAVQNMQGKKDPPHRTDAQHGSDAAILMSKDYGKTWEPGRDAPLMFPGSDFGGPSFIQYGKDSENSPDGYVYAVSGDQWDNGRFLKLGRVPKDKIMERGEWEFFSSLDNLENPVWYKELANASPILDIEGHIGLPEMVYIKSLHKYMLLTWALHTDFYTPTGSELTILESDNPWGPFSLLHYEWLWETREVCPYTPRIPLKWMSGNKGYILHSGNWGFTDNDGSWKSFPQHYRPHVRKFRLDFRTDPKR